MSTYVAAGLRRQVVARAAGLCEYCLLHADDNALPHEVDHVVSEKHGGPTVADNLALACVHCNRHKGSDLSSVAEGGGVVALFNPRIDRWSDHFALVGVEIVPRTLVGEVTVRLLQINSDGELFRRLGLREQGRYPRPAALRVAEST